MRVMTHLVKHLVGCESWDHRSEGKAVERQGVVENQQWPFLRKNKA